MKDQMIDVMNRFDYDSDLLKAAEHDDWFIKNTEPHPAEDYRPVKPVEELMDQFVCQGRFVRAQG
jgi:hypothetical protein